MELLLERDVFADDYTLGVLTVDGKSFGYTVEDEDRGAHPKVPMETAIPPGRYRVATTWSNRYQRKMPLVMDVPGFRGIRIHTGNDDDDTAGCILPGLIRTLRGVAKSGPAVAWLYDQIAKVEAQGGQVWLTVSRRAGIPLAPRFA